MYISSEDILKGKLRTKSTRLTSGGNLAECYMHGLELVHESVRQIRGVAINQSQKHDTAIIMGGPMVTPVSSIILGSEATL